MLPLMLKSKAKLKKTTKIQKEKVAQTEKKHSHLYLHDKKIRRISEKLPLKYLTVLYLYNNEIEQIENLSCAPNLRDLYLHNNHIKKIENLDTLTNLRRLFLGHNEICVVEGLENLSLLEEFYIEKQRIREGNTFCFDPRSVYAIRNSLQILDISRNNISDLSYLTPLRELKELYASNNDLCNLDEICEVVRHFYYLFKLDMSGNPVSKVHRYRELLTANTVRMQILDNKAVNEVTRSFMKRFEQEKLNRKSTVNMNIADLIPGLPRNHPPALEKAVSDCIIKTSIESNFNQGFIMHSKSDKDLPLRTGNKRLPPVIKRQKALCKKKISRTSILSEVSAVPKMHSNSLLAIK